MPGGNKATEEKRGLEVSVLIGARAIARAALDFWLRCVGARRCRAVLVLEDSQFKAALGRQVAEVVERRSRYVGQRQDDVLETSFSLAFLYQQALEALTPAELRDVLADLGATGSVRGATLPTTLPQPTFQESKSLAASLTDGHLLRGWSTIPGEVALRHAWDGQLDTKFMPSPYWEGVPTCDRLARLDQDDAIAVLFLVGMAAQKRGTISIRLPELAKRLGWAPRSAEHRLEMLDRLWTDARLADSLHVIGARPGRYLDPITKKRVELRSDDALIRITGLRRDKHGDGNSPPIEISFVAGPVLERFRDTPALQRIGDLMRIAPVPAGKPSGAWAKSIGLALQQKWREQATHAEIRRVGEDKHTTLVFRPTTRRELLGLFVPQPSLDAVLAGPQPRRAIEYWNKAMDILRVRRHIISGHNRAALCRVPDRRSAWQKNWLDEPLDIRPGSAVAAELMELRRNATRARRRRSPK